MSKSGRIGTNAENHYLVEYVRRVWPKADRSPKKGSNDYGDYSNVGVFLVEAKKRAKLTGEFVGWVNTALDKTRAAAERYLREGCGYPSPSKRDIRETAEELFPWVIFMSGNKHNQPDIDLCVMPASLARDALNALVDLVDP